MRAEAAVFAQTKDGNEMIQGVPEAGRKLISGTQKNVSQAEAITYMIVNTEWH